MAKKAQESEKSNQQDESEQATSGFSQVFENFNAEENIDSLKESVSEAAEVTADFIRKYPVQSVLGAAAIGFIIGSLLRRK